MRAVGGEERVVNAERPGPNPSLSVASTGRVAVIEKRWERSGLMRLGGGGSVRLAVGALSVTEWWSRAGRQTAERLKTRAWNRNNEKIISI